MTSVIDLYAGVSTAPVEIMVEDQKPGGGFITVTDPGGGVRLPGQWYCSTPGSRGRGSARCCSPTDED